jgi:hypothetical protein
MLTKLRVNLERSETLVKSISIRHLTLQLFTLSQLHRHRPLSLLLQLLLPNLLLPHRQSLPM